MAEDPLQVELRDARFLLLLGVSTVLDFLIGGKLERTEDERARKRLVTLSVVINLGILGFFKYFDFFVESTADLLAALGFTVHMPTLQVLLPVGISFYTFQTLSYTIDVYRRRMPATRDFLGFALFVSFFPQLVAGPIERASRLLPQIEAPREVTASKVQAGLWLLVWGYFKKTVIADQAALVVADLAATRRREAYNKYLVAARRKREARLARKAAAAASQ